MRPLLLSLVATMVLPLVGCDLYFHDDAPPCVADDWGSVPTEAPAALYELRNAQTGSCEVTYDDTPSTCVDCDPCAVRPNTTTPESPPILGTNGTTNGNGAEDEAPFGAPIELTWGRCTSECTGLSENACLDTTNCRGIYEPSVLAEVGGLGQFRECWENDSGSPPPFDDCSALDAVSCSQTERCVSVHAFRCGNGMSDPVPDGFGEPDCGVGEFIQCAEEPQTNNDGCYSDFECGTDERCTASEECLKPPKCVPGEPCDSVCFGRCVPENPPECFADYECGEGFRCATCEDPPSPGGPDGAPDRACGGICIPDVDPPQECYANYECGLGFRCEQQGCEVPPSDPSDPLPPGLIACPGICTPEPPGCFGDFDCGPEERCSFDLIPTPQPSPSEPPSGMGADKGLTSPLFGTCVPNEVDPNGCYGSQDCKMGFSCNAEDVCLPPPGCDSGTCPAVCYGECIPDDIIEPLGCFDDFECGLGAFCQRPEDCTPAMDCTMGESCFVPACFGVCTPIEPTSCSAITDEMSCIGADSCTPFYTGTNCVCDPAGCECTNWTFDSCNG